LFVSVSSTIANQHIQSEIPKSLAACDFKGLSGAPRKPINLGFPHPNTEVLMSTINSIPTPARPTPAASGPKINAGPEAKRPAPAASPAGETSFSFSSAGLDLANKSTGKESV
jgi:hypothetical protein